MFKYLNENMTLVQGTLGLHMGHVVLEGYYFENWSFFSSKFEHSVLIIYKPLREQTFFPCLRFGLWHLEMLYLQPFPSIKDPRGG